MARHALSPLINQRRAARRSEMQMTGGGFFSFLSLSSFSSRSHSVYGSKPSLVCVNRLIGRLFVCIMVAIMMPRPLFSLFPFFLNLSYLSEEPFSFLSICCHRGGAVGKLRTKSASGYSSPRRQPMETSLTETINISSTAVVRL